MKKTISSGRNWFLRPYFPFIRGIFVLRNSLRFLFRALEVPKTENEEKAILVNVLYVLYVLYVSYVSYVSYHMFPMYPMYHM